MRPRDKINAASERIREKRRRDRELNKNSYIEDTSVFKGKTLPNRIVTDSNFSQNMVSDTTVVTVSFDDCFPCLPQPSDEGLSDQMKGISLDMQPKIHAIAGQPVNPMAYNTEVSTKRYGKSTESGKYRLETSVASTNLSGSTVSPSSMSELNFSNPVGS